MPPAFEARELIKDYPVPSTWKDWARLRFSGGKRRALDGASLTVGAGERVAMVGPNGAGKTTLARIACGVVLPDAGAAEVAGEPVNTRAAWRRKVGFARPDDPALHGRLDVREALRFHAALYDAPSSGIDEVLKAVDGDRLADRRVQTLSGGEKARVSLAKALLHRPALLVLDELSRVLDPGAAERTRALLKRTAAEGAGVLLITHDLHEAAGYDRVVVMEAGKAVASGPWAEVGARAREVFGL